MEGRVVHTIADTAETVESELVSGGGDALLDLYNSGGVSVAEVKAWYATGELSQTAKDALAAAACQAAAV